MNIPLIRLSYLFASYLKPQWMKVLLLAALLFASSAMALLPPQILRFYIDAATHGSSLQMLALAAFLYLGGVLLGIILIVWATYMSENVGWTATNMLRADLVKHCLELDMFFHNAHTPGELIERIDGDVSTLANFFSQFVLSILSSMFVLVGVLVLLYREDWRLGLVFTVFAVCTLFVMNKIRGLAIPHWQLARQASANFFGFLEERLAGCEDIRSSAAAPHAMRRFHQLLRERFSLERKAGAMGSIIGATAIILFTVGYLLAFSLGVYLFRASSISIGTVYLIFQYIQLLERPIQQVTAQVGDLQRASASIKRVEELLQTQSKIQDGWGAVLPDNALSVEFQNTSFSYNPAKQTLHDISFRVGPGKVLGVLGRTGSGKTTIARLIFRLYDPTSGVIKLGDVNICTAHLTKLRNRIGMVTQDIQFFHAAVRDNLTFFDRSISDPQIIEALEDLGMGAWYRGLPDGLDTKLEASGGFSAGEAQLLAFTRAFLKNPDLVILDEASSRLDPATEQAIERAIGKLLHNRTGIIIAHRLATIQHVDELLILEEGRICEQGSREALQHDLHSHYYRLLQGQVEEVVA